MAVALPDLTLLHKGGAPTCCIGVRVGGMSNMVPPSCHLLEDFPHGPVRQSCLGGGHQHGIMDDPAVFSPDQSGPVRVVFCGLLTPASAGRAPTTAGAEARATRAMSSLGALPEPDTVSERVRRDDRSRRRSATVARLASRGVALRILDLADVGRWLTSAESRTASLFTGSGRGRVGRQAEAYARRCDVGQAQTSLKVFCSSCRDGSLPVLLTMSMPCPSSSGTYHSPPLVSVGA